MLIDWFTVAAQVINFLILVYLLKRFLYQPIVRHMNEREEKIANRLQQAADKRAEAQRQIDEFQHKQEEIEQQRAQKLEKAEEEAQKRQQELLEQARRHVENKRHGWLQSLDKEKDEFAHSLKKHSSQKILRCVQRALQDLADEPLNNRLAEVLLARMKNLDHDLRERLARAAEAGDIIVRTTCKLDAAMKRKITTALHEFCNKDAEVDYQVDSGQPLGVEVSAGSVKFSWSIAGYLEELEEQVLTLIEEKSRQAREPSGEQADPDDNRAAGRTDKE